jgi:hypothetical protein
MTHSPVAGFTSAETFTCGLRFDVFFRRFVPQYVLLILHSVVLFRALLAGLGAEALGWPVASALACAVAIFLYRAKKRQFDDTWGAAILELTPTGIAVVDRRRRTVMAWEQIQRIGTADLVNAKPDTLGLILPPIARLLVAVVVLSARRPEQDALFGIATTPPSATPSSLVAAQARQYQNSPAGGSTARPAPIFLTPYDQNWRSGRIGEWINAYRPDLLSP